MASFAVWPGICCRWGPPLCSNLRFLLMWMVWGYCGACGVNKLVSGGCIVASRVAGGGGSAQCGGGSSVSVRHGTAVVALGRKVQADRGGKWHVGGGGGSGGGACEGGNCGCAVVGGGCGCCAAVRIHTSRM